MTTNVPSQHRRLIDLHGQTLAAISVNGSAPGPPVVFVHGITGRAAFQSLTTCEETIDEWIEAFGHHDAVVFAELFREFTRFDLSDLMRRIGCMTLIAGCGADSYILGMHSRWMFDQIHGAELVLWPGAGHMFFAERTQELQELLVRWLNRLKFRRMATWQHE